MAADDLYFLRSGSEDRPFVLVKLVPKEGSLAATAVLMGVEDDGLPQNGLDLSGDVQTVLSEASEYAMLNGYDLRIELNGQEWPEELGIIGNKPDEESPHTPSL
ncbi:hypothetical protein [Aureimonas altamirensis]|uniref:hypothetical protein n=1 Tax=Aureimonas altamirensis TaxID=370622 RepID=UPI003019D446